MRLYIFNDIGHEQTTLVQFSPGREPMTLHSLNFIIEPSDYFCQQHENVPYVFMGIELVSGGSFGRCEDN